MYILSIDEKTLNDLRALFHARVVTLGNELRGRFRFASANTRNEQRAAFDRAVDFLYQIKNAPVHETVPALPHNHPRAGQPLILADDFDPRAEHPRCVHGKFFDEECNLCAAPLFGNAPITTPTAQ